MKINKKVLKDYIENRLTESQQAAFMDDYLENIDNPALDELLIDEFFEKKGHKTVTFHRWIGIAASFVLIAGAAVWFAFHNTDANEPLMADMVEVTTTAGVYRSVILPDSSEVFLQPESKLAYSKTMDGKLREVSLEGEAFLHVTKNAAHPFVLHCNNLDVKVLGTSFNVSSYTDDRNAEVTLYSGSVIAKSTYNNKVKETEMKPNEHIIINKADGSVSKHKVPTANIHGNNLSGKGDLIFINEKLGDIIHKLERRYNINITIVDSTAKDMPLYAIFINDESLTDMLSSFSEAANTTFKINDK